MYILSIDIGILNLGYVYSKLRIEGNIHGNIPGNKLKKEYYDVNNITGIEIISCDRIDITNFKHSKVKFCDCLLHHDYCIPDYLDHFIQEYSEMFDQADLILIERQPPVGITNVQDLLFSRFRNKVELVSPNRIHKFFGMSKDYFERKNESERIAEKYLNNFNKYNNNIRKHDISDAMLMIIWYYSTNIKTIPTNQVSTTDFEQFRFLTKK